MLKMIQAGMYSISCGRWVKCGIYFRRRVTKSHIIYDKVTTQAGRLPCRPSVLRYITVTGPKKIFLLKSVINLFLTSQESNRIKKLIQHCKSNKRVSAPYIPFTNQRLHITSPCITRPSRKLS